MFIHATTQHVFFLVVNQTRNMAHEKKHMIFIFYSLLTWYIAPLVCKSAGLKADDKVHFALGFALSLFLYEKYGKDIIDGKKAAY